MELVSNNRLMELLKQIDNELDGRIKIIAVGGTAMTLLGIKPSTKDLDFELFGEDLARLRKVLKRMPIGYKIDMYEDGLIFTQRLPDDHVMKAIPIKTELKNIDLLALHPLDIIVTKIGRLSERDEEDIKTCIERYHIMKKDVKKRGAQVDYILNKESYEMNLHVVLTRFFQ